MHTGEPIQTVEGYTGLDVIRGARIKEAGHGGEALAVGATLPTMPLWLSDALCLPLA